MLWTMKKALYRLYHLIMKVAIRIIPFPVPGLFPGAGSLGTVPETIQSHGVDHVFVVTDKGLVAAGIVQRLLSALEEHRIPSHSMTRYSRTRPSKTSRWA